MASTTPSIPESRPERRPAASAGPSRHGLEGPERAGGILHAIEPSRRFARASLILVATLPWLGVAAAPDPIAERIRVRLEQAGQPAVLAVGDEHVYASRALPQFYEDRLFRPVWVADGRAAPGAARLVEAIRDVRKDGLQPADYHLDEIDHLMRLAAAPGTTNRPAVLADLDLLLTDAFLVCGSHLLAGRIDPESFDPEWVAVRRERDLTTLLARDMEDADVAAVLRDLRPEDPAYGRLLDALARYREIAAAGGWAKIPPGPALRMGDRDERVELLRARLARTGDAAGAVAGPTFDADLEEAVRRFQRRHKLEADGVVGTRTLSALNVSVAERIRQIELNLERWRWLPQDLGERYILVNLPDYRLQVVEGGHPVLEMGVIVGRDYRRTPVFSDRMRYLVLNPWWEIPPKLAVQDKLPLLRADPGYAAREGIRAYEGYGADGREVDIASVDWSRVSAARFPYRLRQEPGPRNALGMVKFMFPNRFNVYLHDTPARELFAHTERDFSSGCVRVERALDLAEYLLAGSGLDRVAIEAALTTGRERTIPLAQPIPVHLLHWTAWADEDGTVQFRRDLYGRDAKLDAALRLPPPEE